MNIVFYSFAKRKNSTKRPSSGSTTYDCQIKSPCSMLNPVIELALTTAPDWNYCYIQACNRYYWITDKTYDSGIWFITCKVDPLASGKTDILGSSAHVLYSSSNYNLNIPDPRIITTGSMSLTIDNRDFIGSLSQANINNGTYCLTVMSDATNISSTGATVTYYMTASEMTLFARMLNSQDKLDQLKLLWNNPYEGIIECYYIPFSIGSYMPTSTVTDFTIANLHFTGLTAKVASSSNFTLTTATTTFTTASNIWYYGDFRDLNPYTTYELFIPYCGSQMLDPSLFLGEDRFNVQYIVDFVSGNIQASVNTRNGAPIASFNGNCKIQLPLAQAQSRIKDVATIAGGIATVVGGVAAESGTMMAAGALSAFHGITTGAKYNTMGGFNGSILGMIFGSGGVNVSDWQHIRLSIRRYATNDTPANIRERMGNALNAVVSLSTLTGYVQTLGASISGAWTDAELSEINAALDSGIYIE